MCLYSDEQLFIGSARGGVGGIKITEIYKTSTILTMKIMTAAATRTIYSKFKNAFAPTILQRIAGKDQSAVNDCVETYGNFIWALAKKLTNSREEAEAATREIFIDIWEYAEHGESLQTAENVLIAMIARRRLIKYLQ